MWRSRGEGCAAVVVPGAVASSPASTTTTTAVAATAANRAAALATTHTVTQVHPQHYRMPAWGSPPLGKGVSNVGGHTRGVLV